MTRMAAEILELTERIESLGAKQKVNLLERVLTPEMELRFAMEHMARLSRNHARLGGFLNLCYR